MNFDSELQWATELLKTVDEQIAAIAKLPTRTAADRKVADRLRRKADELQAYARSMHRAAELKQLKAENAALRRQASCPDNAEARA